MAAGLVLAAAQAQAAPAPAVADAARIDLHWGVKIPLRDGVKLNATVYTPKDQAQPAACVFTLTPYISQSYHDRGVYFAAHGIPFLTVDVRGRGNSEGRFRPLIQEAQDGYDVVEWLAKQPYCNGKVSMWGGSYAGYDQWATARERPPHLATIVPVASAYPGADFPYHNNIPGNYLMQWLTFTSGHASQEMLFGDQAFWSAIWKERYRKGEAFSTLEHVLGGDQPTLHEWLAHPYVDSYIDACGATSGQLAAVDLPILTITGSYDDDQLGAMTWYRKWMAAASPAQRARHFLIIGPWDHAGTRTPMADVGGLHFGPDSLIDLPAVHVQWYNWTMAGGPRPDFLKDQVAYYVMGADRWRYAPSLEAVTAESKPFFLDSQVNADHVLSSGSLDPKGPGAGRPDHYVYDPRDTSPADVKRGGGELTDQAMVFALDGKELVYHSAVFDRPTEISGFFRLSAFIAIDQPDTDFQATVYEIDGAGHSIRLTHDTIRARYRESLREPRLITTKAPLRYDFDHFTFVSRQVAAGSRLRLVIAPINSISVERNYNSGKPVVDETMADARAVSVSLVHDKAHPSALYVPMGRPE
jgi:putative CocE/NonD family hydrolase